MDLSPKACDKHPSHDLLNAALPYPQTTPAFDFQGGRFASEQAVTGAEQLSPSALLRTKFRTAVSQDPNQQTEPAWQPC